jgi:carboxyl-terminal processing protease
VVQEAFNFLSVLYVEPLPPSSLLDPAIEAIEEGTGHTLSSMSPRVVPSPVASPARVAPDGPEALPRPGEEAWAVFAADYCSLLTAAGDEVGDPSQQVAYPAIRAMIAAVNEGHTRFLPPELYREHVAWQAGDSRYEGIGARLRSNPLGIQQVFPGSPAEDAGLKAGDLILAIDGEPAQELSATDAVQLVRGEAGTIVTLKIARSGVTGAFDLDIARGSVRVPLVESRVIDDIGYVRISSFPASGLLEDLTRELESIEEHDVKGLILDLRGNGGGRLDVGTRVAALFLPGDAPIYQQTTRREQVTTRTTRVDASWTRPMNVLIDDGTASMGEILAAALQEHEVARLIGVTTSGSVAGSIVVPLSDGSGLQVTTLRIDSGLGTVLNNIGVHPDIEAESTVDEILSGEDSPLDIAIEDLRLRLSEAERLDPEVALPQAA